MARFNSKVVNSTATTNLAGGAAFKESAKLELVSILLTSFLKDQFYRTGNDTAQTLVNLVSQTDKKFAAKAAIYARTKAGMRSVSHLVAGEIAKAVKGEEWTKNFFNKVVNRPDDMFEILAYYTHLYAKKNKDGKFRTIPSCLKKGFATAISRFDAYALAKYRGENKEISLVDVVNLVHPKPTDKNKEALKELMKGKLKSTGANKTWETALTQAGQSAETEEEKDELKEAAWKDLLSKNQVKYFALLRNLRNILEQAPDCVDLVCEKLVDAGAIKKSLVLPFRFITAYNVIKGMPQSQKLLKALSEAIEISLDNVPKFKGSTLIMLDVSGSMSGQPIQIGAMFCAVLAKTNLCDVILFNQSGDYYTINPKSDVFDIVEKINERVGGGTNLVEAFREANKAYDRIIILSDMQTWVEYGVPAAYKNYKKKFNCETKIYSWDLQGYGTIQFPERSVSCLAGWSDKAFDTLKFLEEDKDALIKEIESIEI